MLERTRKIWWRRVQQWLFDRARIQDLLDEKEQNALEDHMGFRGQFPVHRRFQIAELQKLGLVPSSSVLEIGCGPLTAGLPLIEYLQPGRYVGVDVRPAVLDLAWQQIGKHGLSGKNPQLFCSDNFADDELGNRKFDFIWSFSVLYHLSDDILDRYFATVAKRIRGIAVANVQTYMDDSTWLQFPFLKRSIETYEAVAAKHGLKTRPLGTLADRGFRSSGEESGNTMLEFTASQAA